MPSIRDLMVPHLRSLDTYQGVDPMEVMAERAGIPASDIIRLNGNENPYGPSPQVTRALGSFEHYNHYPDPGQRTLRGILSHYLNIAPELIVCGNGSDELIYLILRLFLAPGDNIILPTPTFGMYAFSAEVVGGRAISVPRTSGFEIDEQAILRSIDSHTKAIFFASPNNPTGNTASDKQIRTLLDTGVIVVVDETYYEFCGQSSLNLLSEYENLIILRTFSKWAGLAGLRIGLGVMSESLAGTMMSMKPPYNVNLAAEVALTASLEDRETLMTRVDAIVQERSRLMANLSSIPNVKPYPSEANFILTQLPDGRGKEIFEGLCSRGIFLRYFGREPLTDFVRMSVGLPSENDAVIDALTALVGG